MRNAWISLIWGILILSCLSGCYVYTREPLPPPAIIIMPEGPPLAAPYPPPPPPASGAVGPVRRY